MSCIVCDSTTTKAKKMFNTKTEGGVIFTYDIRSADEVIQPLPKTKKSKNTKLTNAVGGFGKKRPQKGAGPEDLYPLFVVFN